jgi:drug/metabolite transporter (DMT)-like permease
MIIIYFFLLIMVFLWSFSFVVVDIAVEFIPSLSLALYRFVIASLMFALIDGYRYIKGIKKQQTIENTSQNMKKKPNIWLLLMISSFSGVSLFFFVQYASIKMIGPSLPALFVCLLAPVLISFLALLLFQEKLNKVKLLGFIIATVGGFLLVTGGNLENLSPISPNFFGYFLAILTPFLWATYTIVTKRLSLLLTSYKLIKYVAYLGCIELLIFVVIGGEGYTFLINFFNPVLFISGLYLGIGCYIIGYYIWNKAQSTLKSFKASSFLYIEPFITLFFSILLRRNESVVLWNLIGGIIVLVAVFIINYESRSKQNPAFELEGTQL